MAHKARRRPSWRRERGRTRPPRYRAAFAAWLINACKAPTVRIPDTVELTIWFSLPWHDAVAMDPTYYARNEAPLEKGSSVISKVPRRLKGRHGVPGQAGVIVACEPDHETYLVAFDGTSNPLPLKRDEIEPRPL